MFAVRPREIHFGIPFVGRNFVAEGEWPNIDVDLLRIRIPPLKRRFYNVDWRRKFVFDMQLPDAETIFEYRSKRAVIGTHRFDRSLTLTRVQNELAAYEAIALLLKVRGFRVYVRHEFQGPPRSIVD